MEKFTTVTGVAMPLKPNSVDTDQIVPAQFMKHATKAGYDDTLFHTWRRNTDFILKQARYAHATIPGAGSGSDSDSDSDSRTRHLGIAGLRVPRRSSAPASPTSSKAGLASKASSPPRCRRTITEAFGTRSRPHSRLR